MQLCIRFQSGHAHKQCINHTHINSSLVSQQQDDVSVGKPNNATSKSKPHMHLLVHTRTKPYVAMIGHPCELTSGPKSAPRSVTTCPPKVSASREPTPDTEANVGGGYEVVVSDGVLDCDSTVTVHAWPNPTPGEVPHVMLVWDTSRRQPTPA